MEFKAERFGRQSLSTNSAFRHVLSTPSFYRIGFAAANRVPTRILYSLADLVGDLSLSRYKAREQSVRQNLARVFPDITGEELSSLTRKVFRQYARYLVDYARFRGMSPEKLDRTIPEIDGVEHISAVFRSCVGTILVTGHIGNWELGALYFARMGIKVNIVTIPDNAPRIHTIRQQYRSRNNIRTIVMDGSPFIALEILAALRRGEMVAMLVDRPVAEDGVQADFFGRRHSFPRGPFLLSRATGAAILPAFIVREGKAYKGYAEPPFFAEGNEDESCAHRLGQALERMIRRFPDQWYNFDSI